MADVVTAILATATTASSAGLVTAIVNDTPTTVFVAKGLTVAAGEVLVLNRIGSQWVAVAIYSQTAPVLPDNPSAPPPKPPSTSGTLTVAPVETRSYRGEWRSETDLFQGNWQNSVWGNNTGCAFYGSKPRSLAGATVTSATIKVRRKSSGGMASAQSTTLWLVTQRTRPSGTPTITSATAGPSLKWGQSTTFTIPDSWAQAMVNGTAGGLAIHQADEQPYVIWDGRGSWSPSMTMSIKWTRS